MLQILNTKLINLIKNSQVLKNKLNAQQIKKFIKRASFMSEEGQNQLIELLTKEKNKIKQKPSAPAINQQLLSLHEYQKNIKNTFKTLAKEALKNAEHISKNHENETMKNIENQIKDEKFLDN